MGADCVNTCTLRGAVVDYSKMKGVKGDDGYAITLRLRDYDFRVIYFGKIQVEEFLKSGEYIVVYGALSFYMGGLVVKANKVIGGSSDRYEFSDS